MLFVVAAEMIVGVWVVGWSGGLVLCEYVIECVSACVRACVRACACVRARACVCAVGASGFQALNSLALSLSPSLSLFPFLLFPSFLQVILSFGKEHESTAGLLSECVSMIPKADS